MKVSELFVKCLENEGVQRVYGVPGEENLDILEALRGSKINFVTTRHEQGAAFMADIEGRLTGNVGVCLSTLGPGATNLITSIADAFLDRAPLLAITGQASRDRLHKESHQHIDIISLFKPVTKWNVQINTSEIVTEVVRKAFKTAHTEKPGAVHIDIPEDVMEEDAEGSPMKPQYPFLPEPLGEKIRQAVSIIGDSKKPVLLAGNGVIRLKASESLRNFALKLNIPVVSTFMGKGNMPDDEDLSIYTTGIAPRDHGVSALRESDLIIAVGYDLVEFAPRNFNPFGNKKIIHIDATPAEVDSFYQIACGVLGDINISLTEIAASCRTFNENWALEYRKKVISEIEEHASSRAMPVKPQRLVHEIRQALAPDDILISDVGAHKIWIARLYKTLKPNRCLISNGFASMGIALPGAIAAKLLFPQNKVVAATGDGGFLMNVQELETASRLGTDIIIVIFNDNSYGLIEWKQVRKFGHESFCKVSNPDFIKLARSFGADGVRIGSPEEIQVAFEAAGRSRKPFVIEVPVDYSENIALSSRL